MVGIFLVTSVIALFASPAQNANDIIRQLTSNGKTLLISEESPDKRFQVNRKGEIDPRVFEQRIVKSISNNPFVDGYVRWKLTSFPIHIPHLSDLAFEKLLEQLPKYPENPRANRELCDSVARAATGGRPLNRPEIISLKQTLEKVNTGYRISKSHIIPPDQFRLWLFEELKNEPTRLAIAHLERIASTVSAGWSAKHAISQTEKDFVLINVNGGLSNDDQKKLIAITARISGIDRLTLASVDFSFDGTIVPHWRSTSVDEFDLKRLLRLLKKTTETTDGFLGRDRIPPVKSTP